MGQLIGDLLPSTVGVALSPVPIIAIVLILGTPRARANGVAFGVGWVLGLSAVSAIVMLVMGDSSDPDSGSSNAANILKVALGLLFLVMAAKQWQGRPKPGVTPAMPGWMSAVDSLAPGKALGLGVLLSGVNPKNLALTLTAAASVAQSGLDGVQETEALAVFVILGSLTVVGPVVFFLIAGERAAGPLATVKEFMADNNAVIMFVVLLILGAKMLGSGIAGLSRVTLAAYVPSLEWLPRYDRRWLRADLVGGLAAGAVVIPQAMAYATIANLPVEVGLYTCMVPMAVYAFLGGSRTLSVSTTSTVATLTGSTLLAVAAVSNSTDPAGDLAMLTLLVGLVLLLARICKLGAIIDNISEATLTGIKVGVGLTVAVGQLPKLLGVTGDPTASGFLRKLGGIIDDLGQISVTTAVFSAATIAGLLLLTRFAPRIPGPLVAVVAGIGLVQIASLDQHGVALIAPVPSGLPGPVAPELAHVDVMLGWAIAIALMCFLETAAVAGSVRRPEEPPIDNDQELAANGMACVVGACFQAMPSAGGFSQTAINQRAGARTQLSELVTVVLAVACALFLAGVLSDLPEATLGSLVMVAVLGLIKPAEFVRFWRLSRVEFWVAVVTALCGLSLGLLAAVAFGVVLTLVILIIELDRLGLTELQPVRGGEDVEAVSDRTETVPGLLILRFDGPLYTANVRGVNRQLVEAVERTRPSVVVADATAVGALTVTVMDQLQDLEDQLATWDTELWFSALTPRALATARLSPRWQELDDAGRLHRTSAAAVRHFRERAST